jgi:hypothetical protein
MGCGCWKTMNLLLVNRWVAPSVLLLVLISVLPVSAESNDGSIGFSDQDLTSGVGGVQVSSPVPPGPHEFALSFQLPQTGSSPDLTLQLPYPTATYSVYVPEIGVTLNSSGLADGGSMVLGDESYKVYRASNLERASVVSAELSGLSPEPGVGPSQLAVLSLAVVLLVLGSGAALFILRTRRRAPQIGHVRPDLEEERLEAGPTAAAR